MKPIIRNIAKYIAGIAGGLFLLSLVGYFLMYKKAPDLHQAKWKSISVEYLVREGTNFQKQTWSTTNQTVLERLSNALKVERAGDLWGIGTMTTNKITLQLVNGKSFIIYINEPTKLCMNEFLNPPTGFSLKVTRDFYDELKAVIESDVKTKIYFRSTDE